MVDSVHTAVLHFLQYKHHKGPGKKREEKKEKAVHKLESCTPTTVFLFPSSLFLCSEAAKSGRGQGSVTVADCGGSNSQPFASKALHHRTSYVPLISSHLPIGPTQGSEHKRIVQDKKKKKKNRAEIF